MTIYKKSSAGGSSKNLDKPAAVRQTISLVATASTPFAIEGASWTILSTTDGWNSSRRITEFLLP
jgi:hypothetical protein